MTRRTTGIEAGSEAATGPPPIDPDFRPGEWAVPAPTGGDDAASEGHADAPRRAAAARKSAPLAVLYPEAGDYRVLSPERYTDPAFLRDEWAGVWSRTWTCAGLVADLARPGDWIRYDLGPDSIVVVRGRDGAIRAFHNVCRHRGRRLVADEAGHAPSLVCPFHGWIYGLDGANRLVTDRALFDPAALCGDLDLAPVRCETWGAFVFVCLGADAPPLAEFLGPIPEMLEAYRIEAMHLVKDVAVAVECNWKVACEAFLEPYHTHATHPQILGTIDELYNQYDFYANGHSRVISPLGVPSPRLGLRDEGSAALPPDLAGVLAAAGVDPERFEGGPQDVRRALVAARRRPDNPFGLDYARFADDQLVDNWNPSVFPNLALNVLPEAVQVMRFLPDARDPGRCTFHVWTLMAKTREGVRPTPFFGVEPEADLSGQRRPPRRHTTQYAPELGEVLEQDVSNMPLVQLGMASSACRTLRLSEQEQRIAQLHAEIDRGIRAAGAGGSDRPARPR